MNKRILIVEDDIAFGKMVGNYLTKKAYNITSCATVKEARDAITNQTFDILITDLKLPDESGLRLLEHTKEIAPKTDVIVMTGYADVTTAVEAIKKGALEYISKPFRPEELLMVVEQSLEENKTTKEQPAELPNSAATNPNFIAGISESSNRFNEYVKLVGPTDMCVLIQGESGTGKEVAAKAIHRQSTRSNDAFIAVDCGSIPKEIAASEFFGHIKGSFTGAIADKKGHFEAAHGGTLFLDEVGNLSYENQIQLLRALQERKVKPVGGTAEIDVDIRVISATNEDLLAAVKTGKFREDLYHRLNEFAIEIPPLRQRKEDLILFSDYFLSEANKGLNKEVLGLSKEVEIAFKKYHWPGNLRELKNVIRRSVLLAQKPLISLDVIPREVLNSQEARVVQKDFSRHSNEKQLIVNALREANYNKSRAAILLEITRKTLYNKMAQYQIEI